MEEVQVFVVVADDKDGKTVEQAKFFRSEHAFAHVEKIGPNWRNKRVIPRMERADEQHPAHQRAPGRPAAWE